MEKQREHQLHKDDDAANAYSSLPISPSDSLFARLAVLT
jgi:hypothetical protein